ncbi:putative TetR-family transcriptional regulator [Actinoplanes missouriensis 431]|uniref:Putative TetR-family transcriptional regulator n=1 Tax=Actinoplanes missouriensis (strain ATCC 14538 / DSM 43046 / CBS 188.64 / JCM 3121 / NBRC 102363 / NCIMB 12654 / NRRL B-3342 / UNCC 431) TaxID=512565 RepID=I0H6T1_ACTM4|nr:TetR/AcrR family transcriptional regulator [Actinoplanes missouriensis]BAL88718.1 putative TetR-family transcriptional regulator [Actinoplanes missouriensis 431]
MTQTPVGRRERKKAATRQAIADAALRLFLEHGYDRVSLREIADAADVSTTTLFKHFSGKEALVFDQERDNEAQLIAAVRGRAGGQDIVGALREHFLGAYLPIARHPQAAEFVALVDATPALRSYAERMWTRHTDSLSAAIAEECGADHDDLGCVALARFVLEIPALVRGRPDPRAAIEAIFDILARGWVRPDPVR